jgi:hypothetical protein
MVRAKKAAAAVGVVGALGAGAIVGCVGGDGGAPATPGIDGSVPGLDAQVPGAAGVDTSVPVDSGPDTATPSDASDADANEADTSPPDAGPAPGAIRFAWFVGANAAADGGAPPGVDVCVAPHGTGAWQGPLLAASSLAQGLRPFDVSWYLQVAPGQYDARIVPAGSATCDLPDAGGAGAGVAGDAGEASAPVGPPPDLTSLPPVVSGGSVTVVLVDPLPGSTNVFDVLPFTDTTPSATSAKVRFVNVSGLDVSAPAPVDAGDDGGGDAAVDGAVDAGTVLLGADFGLGGGDVFTRLFTNVTTQDGTQAGNPDHGYVDVGTVANVDTTLVSQTNLAPDFANAGRAFSGDGLTLGAGDLATGFYASEVGSGGQRAPVLVVCKDTQPDATTPALARCTHTDVATGNGDVGNSGTRFANFLADGTLPATPAPALDFCIKYHGYGAYVGPLASAHALSTTGIAPATLTGYFNVHGGFDYDVRVVAGGATDCNTSVLDTSITAAVAPGGAYETAFVVGYQNVPADAGAVPPYDAGPPFDAGDDAGDAGPQPTSTGVTTLAQTFVLIEDEQYDANQINAVRLVHVAPGHPDPMTVTATTGVVSGSSSGGAPVAGPVWALDDVPYGGFSTHPPPTDPYGYVTIPATAVTLNVDAESFAFTPSFADQATLYAYSTPKGVGFLYCDDYGVYPFNQATAQCCVVGSTCGQVVGGSSGGGGAGMIHLGSRRDR